MVPEHRFPNTSQIEISDVTGPRGQFFAYVRDGYVAWRSVSAPTAAEAESDRAGLAAALRQILGNSRR